MYLLLRVDFSQSSFNSPMLVNKVINKISRVFVLQSLLINSCFVEKLFQVRVNIFQIKTMIGIPSYMTDVLKVGR